MEQSLSFFNWSLKKILSSANDSFEKARIKILFAVLIFSLVKVIIAIAVTWHFNQVYQFERAVVLLVFYLVLLKVLLINKLFLRAITHAMIWLGIILIWTSIIMYAQTVNTLAIQFIFMLVLSSFYLLQLHFAFLYSVLGIAPVLLSLFFQNRFSLDIIPSAAIASPGFEILIVLNFVTIILSHYLFRQAFIDNLREKDALNTQLLLAVKEANQAAESKSDFLSTMSHELRTPLNSVIGVSELLLRDAHNDEQKDNLNILKFSAANLHTLINDILDFNKLGSGKLELESISVHLDRLFGDLSNGLRFQATQKGINFILNIDEEIIGRKVITDPTRIAQIIYNLAGNAIKFTEEGSVALSLKLLHIDEGNISINISVKDTGLGISPDKQEAIFEPFTQANSSTTRNFGGTGLGLAIVKRLLFLFNSAINLKSTPNVGSEFSFDLTLTLDRTVENALPDSTENVYDLSGLRILIAEDNAMNRILLVKIFSKWNCRFSFALNGKEALEKLSAEDFDLILMDLHMPVMDGYEASKAIREFDDPVKSHISIIALTASVSGNLNEKIRAFGMNGFILKPFKLNDLYSKIKSESLLKSSN
ncbi:MAG: response regulator [Sphingobacteriaceae bacterium]|nr:response regulator [Sphingobacteriaceae bacterium]